MSVIIFFKRILKFLTRYSIGRNSSIRNPNFDEAFKNAVSSHSPEEYERIVMEKLKKCNKQFS